MARPKGQPKLGGRQKGTPNKDTQALFDICAKHGVNVFEGMVMIAAQDPDPDRKFEKLEKIAQYLYPKRKAIEATLDPEGGGGFVIKIENYSQKEVK